MSRLMMDGEVWGQAANNVLQVADNVAVAGRAAHSALSSNAFGLMCSPLLLPIYTAVESVAVGMLDSAEAGLERSALGLRSAAQRIEETASDQAQVFNGITESIGGRW